MVQFSAELVLSVFSMIKLTVGYGIEGALAHNVAHHTVLAVSALGG